MKIWDILIVLFAVKAFVLYNRRLLCNCDRFGKSVLILFIERIPQTRDKMEKKVSIWQEL